MSDDQNQKSPRLENLEKSGYQPVTEGYTPLGRRGYTPQANAQEPIPPLPAGGTAQSPKPEGEKSGE